MYSDWMICEPKNVEARQNAIVHTHWDGENIEWDKTMIDMYGTTHHGWDPTHRAIAFMGGKRPKSNSNFHKFGLSTKDGIEKATLHVGN